MRKNLTTKAVHIAIKKNEGLEAFKRQYGYESDEEVYRSLRRIARRFAKPLRFLCRCKGGGTAAISLRRPGGFMPA